MGDSRRDGPSQGNRTAARPTLKDVADRANVSSSTVSNVLNGRLQSVSRQTERRVRRAMEELRYYPNSSARALRSRANGTLAFLLLDEAEKYLADPLTNLILAGVGDVLRERGWSLLIHAVKVDGAREGLFEPLLHRAADGAFVLLSGSPENRRWYVDQLTRMQQPFVVFDEVLEDRNVMSVRAADRDAGRLLTEHLLSRGHRRIAFIATGTPTALIEQRHRGHADALRAAGVTLEPDLVRFEGTWQPAGGAAMATALMALPQPPTAIICGHDMLAIGALRAVQDLGLAVPEAVAVAGFDDYAVSAWMRPTLTSVQLPGYQMGRMGAAMLLDVCTGVEPPARQVVLPVELSARGST